MTGEVEQQLRELVEQFGVKKVHDALVPLIAECKFSDWQCHRDRSYAHRKAAAKAVASMMLVAVFQPTTAEARHKDSPRFAATPG